jgi:hypothetical protein
MCTCWSRTFRRWKGSFELELTDSRRAASIAEGAWQLRIGSLEIACPDAGLAAATLDATLDPDARSRIDLRPSGRRFAELAGRLEPAI